MAGGPELGVRSWGSGAGGPGLGVRELGVRGQTQLGQGRQLGLYLGRWRKEKLAKLSRRAVPLAKVGRNGLQHSLISLGQKAAKSRLGQKWSDLERAKSGTGHKSTGPKVDGPKVDWAKSRRAKSGHCPLARAGQNQVWPDQLWPNLPFVAKLIRNSVFISDVSELFLFVFVCPFCFSCTPLLSLFFFFFLFVSCFSSFIIFFLLFSSFLLFPPLDRPPWTALLRTAQNFALFFRLSTTICILSSLSWSSRGILVAFEAPGP